MKTITISMASAAIILFLSAAPVVNAQSSATVQATGTVLEPASVSSSTGLDFGEEILPGISKSVARSDGNAAKFAVTAMTSNYVMVNFTLPDMLSHETGDDEMAITFSAQDASYSDTDQVTGSAGFDPHVEERLQFYGGNTSYYIWLGGTINPRNDQQAGTYSGAITIDLAYTEL